MRSPVFPIEILRGTVGFKLSIALGADFGVLLIVAVVTVPILVIVALIMVLIN
jgi:hypothetical protein